MNKADYYKHQRLNSAPSPFSCLRKKLQCDWTSAQTYCGVRNLPG